ncbi:hypothetical protein HHL22_08940 [Hymenobacter sp. RP-2-7]|uniref:Uncharacterized protein n=1 Tax=Hymenobacter polaris TaxID=2682546 RepID=A0A7Y0ADF8_9BACT|nr:hypothetical protein [Hymenobacter polaris]NML65328.1 hypothetical protein [Hymenobacter polaris]
MAPALLLISAALLLVMQLPVLVQLPGVREGRVSGVPPGLVLAKLLSGLAVWYLANELRPQQYWFYYNLGLSRAWLWGGVAVLDGSLFMAAAEIIARLWP